MTKTENIEKLEESKRQVSKDIAYPSDKVDESYYASIYYIGSDYDDIKEDR